MQVSERDIITDLMSKIGDDVSRAMCRSVDPSPKSTLTIAIAGASVAVAIVAAVLDELAGKERVRFPANVNSMLAALLVARSGVQGGGEDDVYRDMAALAAAGRLFGATP